MADLQAAATAENLLAGLRGQTPTTSFKLELICIIRKTAAPAAFQLAATGRAMVARSSLIEVSAKDRPSAGR